MERKVFWIEVFPWIIIFGISILFYKVLEYVHFNFFAFIIFTLIFFFARLVRVSLKRFSILTITPIFAFLFPLYIGGFTTGISNLIGVFLGEKIWRKINIQDALRNSFTYASAILVFSLLLPPKGNPSFYQVLIFYLLFSLIFPYFFYLPKFFRLKLKFKDIFYMAVWEHIFALTFNGWAYTFYRISVSKINMENILFLIFIFLSGILIFHLIKMAIQLDRVNFERKILKIFREKLSFEDSMKEIEKILKENFDIKGLNIALYENKDEVKIIYSTYHPGALKNPIVVKRPKGIVWKVIDSKKSVYVPNVLKEKNYLPISQETKSELMFPLIYDEKFLGVFDIESDKIDNFYEDDIKRLEGIVTSLSSQVEILLNINNLREISFSLDKDSENLASITQEFTASITEITEKITRANQNLESAKNILQKNFEILENIGKTMEKMGDDSEKLISSFEELENRTLAIHESYLVLRKLEQNFLKEYNELKEEFEKFLDSYTKIQEFIEFIVDYTTKTRLLSLNAAIEAARFEEKGSGFGIIAEEISKLAETGENLTKKIQEEFTKGEETILKIRKGFLGYEEIEKERNKRMEEINLYMQETQRNIKEYSEKIKKFPKFMKEDIHKLQDIIIKMGEVLTLYDENFKKFEEIGALAEELSASSEEIAAKAQELNLISTKLSELVKIFE
ncbi:MAG: methyl-accepting chemotaxis protein [candidate division WOR-3 bacterium]